MTNEGPFKKDRSKLKPGIVPGSDFWLIDNNEFIERLSLRYELNEFLLKMGEHIGYEIRPSKRKRGYGAEILRLGLQKAKELGLQRVLVTCDEDNIGSKKIIEHIRSPQLDLWQLSETEWLLALRRPERVAQRNRGKIVALVQQLPLPDWSATGKPRAGCCSLSNNWSLPFLLRITHWPSPSTAPALTHSLGHHRK
jgi:Acetyltransferase (GNAT) domain